jgi:hypothetical protein
MSFWNDANLEPKRSFRFLVSLQPGGGDDLQFAVKSTDKPSFSIGEISHSFFNHTFYYPGKVTWNTVSITLVDAVKPGSTELLYKYLASIGYATPVNFNSAIGETITKKSAVSSLGAVRITELGTNPNNLGASGLSPEQARVSYKVGEWTLHNPFITEVNFGSHSYDDEEMVEVTLTLRYDWATWDSSSQALRA